MTVTNAEVLAPLGIAIDQLEHPELEVPILTCSQRQGDVLVRRVDDAFHTGSPIPAAGVVVVRAEASSSNTHSLHALAGSAHWQPNPSADQEDILIQGLLIVTPNSSAVLIHTEEHNVLGIGPGTYEIRRQREFRGEWRRVAD